MPFCTVQNVEIIMFTYVILKQMREGSGAGFKIKNGKCLQKLDCLKLHKIGNDRQIFPLSE